MRFGIRIKFIFILIIAAVLPLFLGLVIVGLLGYRHYERQRGELLQADALYLANGLGNITREQIQPMFSVTSTGEVKAFKFANWANGEKLELRKNQIYQFLTSEGIAPEEIEKTGNREFYEIKKSLTIAEVINIFDNFMS